MSPLNSLIEALREELKQYGEMLALLDQQQEAVIQRSPDGILESAASIEAQAVTIQRARQDRLACHHAVLSEASCPQSLELLELLKYVPADYRPMIKALVGENNHLLLRIQQRARQNQLLLSRSVDSLRQVIGTLCAASMPALYNGDGQILSLPTMGRQLWEAVG